MASTTNEKNNRRKYDQTHKKYREEKIENGVKKQKANPKKHAEYQKDYYHENQDYRAYKIKYARDYRKREPIKSKARKDRKPR